MNSHAGKGEYEPTITKFIVGGKDKTGLEFLKAMTVKIKICV
jgi:hypothetical protein